MSTLLSVNYVKLKLLEFGVATARVISSASGSRNLCCPLAFHPHESSGFYTFFTSDLAGRVRHAYARHRHCLACPLDVLLVCATVWPADRGGCGGGPPSSTLSPRPPAVCCDRGLGGA